MAGGATPARSGSPIPQALKGARSSGGLAAAALCAHSRGLSRRKAGNKRSGAPLVRASPLAAGEVSVYTLKGHASLLRSSVDGSVTTPLKRPQGVHGTRWVRKTGKPLNGKPGVLKQIGATHSHGDS